MTPAEFVHDFHDALTQWFAGTADRELTWRRLSEVSPPEMALVYPSGRRYTGAGFLESIRELYATSPGFEARIVDLEVLREDETHAVVAYTELQNSARNSAASNARSALALLHRVEGRWCWRFIQETASPA